MTAEDSLAPPNGGAGESRKWLGVPYTQTMTAEDSRSESRKWSRFLLTRTN